MLTEERRARIVEIVNEKKAVSVNELIELLDASAATIRRDISALIVRASLSKYSEERLHYLQEMSIPRKMR